MLKRSIPVLLPGLIPSIADRDFSVGKSGAILKTLTSSDISPSDIVATGVCDGQGSINGVIFGSK